MKKRKNRDGEDDDEVEVIYDGFVRLILVELEFLLVQLRDEAKSKARLDYLGSYESYSTNWQQHYIFNHQSQVETMKRQL